MEINHNQIFFMVQSLELKHGTITNLGKLKSLIKKEFDESVSIEELDFWSRSKIEADDSALIYQHYIG